MKDMSYEILDLFKAYGSGPDGIQRILEENSDPAFLYALSPLRKNQLEWLDTTGEEEVLQIGSDYGALTGLLASRCAHVTVMDEADENLEVNRQRNSDYVNITYGFSFERGVENQGKLFDLVLVSSLEPGRDIQEAVSFGAAFLKQGGRLIFSCENDLGLRFLAGGEHMEASCTRQEAKELCEGLGFSRVEFYYPVTDQKLPSSVYSDRYLPSRGEVGAGAALEGPRYACFQEEAVYDGMEGGGLFGSFANGFVVIASNGGCETTCFAKYNRTRRKEFQTRTRIWEKEEGCQVEKSALSPEGKSHLEAFGAHYESLSRCYPHICFLKPVMGERKDRITFPFLKGRTLAECLGEQIRDGKAPVCELEKALEAVIGRPEIPLKPFVPTPELEQVFGNVPDLGGMSYEISNIDGLFENLMVQEENGEEKLYCLDYEWVFDFPIPVSFVRYRILAYFYYRYEGSLCYGSLEGFLKEFGIEGDTAELYANMEKAFQSYVHGDALQGYLANYIHEVTDMEQIRSMKKELEKARDRINQLQEEVEERNLFIRKEQELKRLTNNHVANLEIMIKDLRHEIDELGKLATYLNGHEALVFKARRKLGVQVSKAFPKGTRKRKALDYCVSTVKHPLRYGKMYATKEGRRRIKGDFAIGEDYLKYGKLVFPQVPKEGPMVSIVIPCYNQIGYTYACLQSILEFTKDVTYEVIIADDVSTDATAQLGQYTEGLVICRNQTNQGFLRNCNQAARAARGKYIMFLNNDTKVTEGWLSSLVNLIQSDASIGMVGSKLVYPDGRLQEAGGIIWSDGSGWNYGRLDDPDKPEYNYVKDVDYISGAAILLSTKLWKQIGGFDERFAPAYCEDSDLAFEVRKAGYRVVYQPLSKVIHFEGISNGTDVNGTGLKRYQVENSRKLKEKWAEELKKQCTNTGNPNPFRARERSQGKQVILVVDHYVPTFDKDAGSKTTYQYLKMFLKKGYVVKFLGDNFLHEEPYTTILEQMGIEVLYGEAMSAGIWDWLKKNGDEIDFAYLNRPHIATKYVDFIREHTNMKVIYYGHDLHFLRLGREYKLTKDLAVKREADYWKSVELTMMHKADISYYPSYVEIDAIHEMDASIPAKAITAYVYDQFLDHIEEDFAKREGLLFVGGFAHPPNADAVLWFAEEIFPLIRRALPEANFYIVGSKVTEEIQALEKPGNGIVVKGFVTEEELAELYSTCRMVVVPLRYGAGVKGKVVEAIYNGAPIVTTSTGAEGIPSGETVLEIEDEAAAFAAKTISLYQDPERLAQMCRRTQEYIREYYSLDGAWNVIKDDFAR